MIPILYEKTSTKTNLVPIGAMVDVLSCPVTRERNGIYEATMLYPKDGQLAEELKTERLLYIKPGDDEDPQPMEIMTVTALNDNTLQVYTQHISYRLSGMVVPPFSAATATEAAAKLQQYIGEFTLTTDITSDTAYSLTVPTACRSVLGGMEGSLLDVYGGEFVFDGWDVHWQKSAGSDRGVLIAYGKNLTDINAVADTTGVVTGVLPYYQQQNEDGSTSLIMPEGPVMIADSIMSYDRITTLDCTGEFEGTPSVEQLQQYGASWLQNQTTKTTDSITLSYLDLYNQGESDAIKSMEYVRLCDTVTVWDKRYNIQLTAKVVQIVYDPIAERNDSVQVGEAVSNFADTILSTNQTVDKIQQTYPSRWQQSMYDLASKITGQTDSHVIFLPMEYPSAILVAEDTDLTSAGNRGLYISAAGIAGTEDLAAALQDPSLFSLAITIDGHIIGDRITGLTIEGQQIIGGIIRNTAGTVYINLDTGEAYVPRLIASAGGGVYYGIEQGTFNLSGAEYSGMRFFRMINVAPPFDSPEGDYFQVLRTASGARLRAIDPDGNDLYLDLLGDSGTVSGTGPIFQVRAGSTKSTVFQLNEDGDVEIPGYLRVGMNSGVGSTLGLYGGRIERGGNFVSLTNGGGFYAQRLVGTDVQNVAYMLSDGTIHGINITGTDIDASNQVSGELGSFTQVRARSFRFSQDSTSGLVQFNNNDFGIIYNGTVHFAFGRSYNGTNESIIRLPNGAGETVDTYKNWDFHGWNITNAQIATSSDRRLKKYIAASKEKALPIIDAIPVRQYTYKKGAPEHLSEKKVRFGEVAQELEEIYPEAVIYNEKTDDWYIDKIALIDLLLKGVQELSAKVTSLEAELQRKENANAG